MHKMLNIHKTAEGLPFAALAKEIENLLRDDAVQVPTRLVQPLPGGGSLFVMPALDHRIAITKLITFTPANVGTGQATIQGDVVVFDIVTGQRLFILDGPTVTARRTAAVSLLAAKYLAPERSGPLLIVGAGAQGRAHLEAFVHGLGVQEVMIASRSDSSASALAEHAKTLGVKARVVSDPNAALAQCPLAVTCTPASTPVLQAKPCPNTFIAAVGAFTPKMVELSPEVCQHFANYGTVIVDTEDARHEAGDLLQAGLNVGQFATLRDVVCNSLAGLTGPVLFKSCGWAGWDLAAARTVALSLHGDQWPLSSD
jgi:ornithine cyclodeaminase